MRQYETHLVLCKNIHDLLTCVEQDAPGPECSCEVLDMEKLSDLWAVRSSSFVGIPVNKGCT